MIYKYIAIVFLWLISLLGSTFWAYNKGIVNERNSIEVKQLRSTVLQQQNTILKQQKSNQITSIQLFNLSQQLNSIQESYVYSQKEIHKYEKLLNNTNRINALYLRSIRALSASSVHSLSTTTGEFNAESASTTYVSAKRVAEYELQYREQAEKNRIQLNTLIDWINSQYLIYGEINDNK